MTRNAEDPDYADFVKAIRDGAGPEKRREFADDFLSTTTEKKDMIDFVFPPAVLRDPEACLARGILASTNEQVEEYNGILLDRVHGESRRCFAADRLKDASESPLTTAVLDVVAHQTPQGLPPHCLHIKTNAVYRVLRDLSLNGQPVKTVVVTKHANFVINVKVLKDSPALEAGDEEMFIPRIDFPHVLSSGHTLLRRQFPLVPAYSTTFHGCEGLTFDRIGVDLTRPASTRGRLYTALSTVRRGEDVIVRLRAGESATVLLPTDKPTTNHA